MSDAQPDNTPWALAIHGGAGTIARKSLDAETRRRYQDALHHALAAGHQILAANGTAVDAVQASVSALEDEPLFNAGRGAVFTAEGRIELDASIMDGRTLQCGAVIGLTRYRNPVQVARRVMTDSPHVALAGRGADEFAHSVGFQAVDADYFYTDRRWQQLERARHESRIALDHDLPTREQTSLGTVGAVALDIYSNLAAATSTGGMTNKMWGRVGDTPVIGAGTYASNASCAVSATGHGEFFMRATVARDIAALMEYAHYSLHEATERKVMKELSALGGDGGVIAIDRAGNISAPFNTHGMYRGWVRHDAAPHVAIHAE